MNVRPECVRDCTGLVSDMHTRVPPAGVFVFDILWLVSSSVHSVSFECSVVNGVLSAFGGLFDSAKSECDCLTVKLGENCDHADAFFRSPRGGGFTIWPNHIVKRKKAIVRPQSVTSQCFTFYASPTQAYTNHLCVLISLKVFLNMSILINAWRH